MAVTSPERSTRNMRKEVRKSAYLKYALYAVKKNGWFATARRKVRVGVVRASFDDDFSNHDPRNNLL